MTAMMQREIIGSVVEIREDGFINATQLCKAAGKLFAHYMSSGPTKQFLAALESDIGKPISALIEVRKGGSGPQGTWVHPRVAIDLARWCSPQFAVTVNGWIFELMTRGSASAQPSVPAQPTPPLPAPESSPAPDKGPLALTLSPHATHFDILEYMLSQGKNPSARQVFLAKKITKAIMQVAGYEMRRDGRIDFLYLRLVSLAISAASIIDEIMSEKPENYFGLDD
ncbi:KilA-N domain-containing protein [Tuwongella immobilis]|uniref:KilA-N domain-containing protein n=1 Tax=Tuwongella immobilis TaxID=692036 RepID=A0A6C2YW08_9BACT|nr:KilA-N domain-containing protein [Tuwongella immobilis]VIP05571.1 kila-n domain protein : KilA OS=Proteus mirabilis GN=MC73_06325 PE=4 SV=1: KilA-N [Tuwongella immobilis]VTS08497.1 kila-n domain protein : KilA OS=Proteus mirabilis GN=MC73_06325 PE=4 SV=1: KilA-N [Tuwongella immobilis]